MRRRTSVASANPTISASAVCRLGMAAYGSRELDEARPVVEPFGPRERVCEPQVRNESRWCGRHRDVADEAERVRDDDRVAHPRIAFVAAQVDPEHREPHNRELRQPVGPVDGVEKHPRLDDRSLDVRLVEGAEPLLDADDPVRVCERFGGPAVRETSGDLVCDEEAEPDRKLAQEVAASARESEGSAARCCSALGERLRGRRRSSHRGFEDPFRSLEVPQGGSPLDRHRCGTGSRLGFPASGRRR
jgi:hypothetical protein